MSTLWKLLSGIGGAFIAFVTVFLLGRHSGKQDIQNAQRKHIINSIEERHKIKQSVAHLNNEELDEQLRDPNTRQ